MELSYYLAEVIGLVGLVISLAIFADTKRMMKMAKEYMDSPALLYMGGLMSLGMGAALVFGHNVWQGWPMIITIVGWVALVKGILLILFPNHLSALTKGLLKSNNGLYFGGLIWLVVSLYLLFTAANMGVVIS